MFSKCALCKHLILKDKGVYCQELGFYLDWASIPKDCKKFSSWQENVIKIIKKEKTFDA